MHISMNKPIRNSARLLRLAIVIGLVAAVADCRAQSGSPNLIVIMADDLGWNHIGVDRATGGTHHPAFVTPHLQQLAASGVTFLNAWQQPNCAPTRAAMLSGQYPARIHNNVYVVQSLNRYGGGGVTRAVAQFRGPEQSLDVAPEAITVAEALKHNGYVTAHIGKFHVGGHRGEETLPENAGFDLNIGGFSQGHQPTCFSEQRGDVWRFRDVGRGDFDRFATPYTDEYLTRRGMRAELAGTPRHICDAVGDAAVETIGSLAAGDSPFYLQVHSYAVHGPVRARPDLLQAAEERLHGEGGRGLAEYAGFVAGLDEIVGRIVAAVADPNGDGSTADSIAGDTLIMFTSDNGGTHFSNAPLRGEKGMFTEGGLRVPLIATWPGTIPPGQTTARMVHSVDYYPTLLEAAGGTWRPDSSVHPLDGYSFADALRNPSVGAMSQRPPIYYWFPGYLDRRAAPCGVVIDGQRGELNKLTYFFESDSWELYNLTNDPEEKTNLIQSSTVTAASLAETLNGWLNQEHQTWKPSFPLSVRTGQPALLPVLR